MLGVVLDTNLVRSALVFGGGALGALRCAWRQAHFQPLVSRPTATELLRALAYPNVSSG
jgi:predicted nucleic acid-binding protein